MRDPLTLATAYAPATVGNVAVGFDVLGHALEASGDRVTVRRIQEPVVRIASISGVAAELPEDPRRNTAGMPLLRLRERLELPWGFELSIEKGIPLASGMGGSAASAVASVVAASALLPAPLALPELLELALAGEAVATGDGHADNVAPCLMGGLVLALPGNPPTLVPLPVPSGLRCVLVHPRHAVETRAARQVLREDYRLGEFVSQSARLGAFVAACYAGDLELLRRALLDELVEPQRASLVPAFHEVKRAALDGAALGCSLSGAGPSVFAWCASEHAHGVGEAMRAAFARAGIESELWVSRIDAPGARIVADG